MSEEVKTEVEDGVLIVTINRPEAKNAMNKAAAEGIAAAMDRVPFPSRSLRRRSPISSRTP